MIDETYEPKPRVEEWGVQRLGRCNIRRYGYGWNDARDPPLQDGRDRLDLLRARARARARARVGVRVRIRVRD